MSNEPTVVTITPLQRKLVGWCSVLTLFFLVTLYFGHRSYQKQLDKANAQYAQLKDKDKADTATINIHAATRETQSNQVLIATKAAHIRDVNAATLEKKLLDPTSSVQDVKDQSDKYLTPHGQVLSNGQFAFDQKDVQKFISTKVDDDAVKQDKLDLTVVNATLTDMVSTSKQDLALCETDKASTEKVLVSYQKAAKKSKWGKALDVTEKVGLFAAGALVARGLTK